MAIDARADGKVHTVKELLDAKAAYVRTKRHYTQQLTATAFVTQLVSGTEDDGSHRPALALLNDPRQMKMNQRDLDTAKAKCREHKAAVRRSHAGTERSVRALEASRAEARRLAAELREAMAELEAEQELAATAPAAPVAAGRPTLAEAERSREAAEAGLRGCRADHARAEAACAEAEREEAEQRELVAALRSAADERRREAMSGAQQVARMAAFYDDALALGQAASGVTVVEATEAVIRLELAVPAKGPGGARSHTLSLVMAPLVHGEVSASAPPGEEARELAPGRLGASRAPWAQSTPITAELVPASVAVAPIVDSALDRLRGAAAVAAIVHDVMERLVDA